MDKFKVLFCGESWFFTTVETKGFDQFTIGGYETEIERVRSYMKDFAELDHIPAHLVPTEFPDTAEALAKYDVVVISDVGSNTFLLHPDTFFRSKTTANKLQAIADYVAAGGAFAMIGGYMTFQGIEGKGKWHGSIIEKILPVEILPVDDRIEYPEGVAVKLHKTDRHEIVQDFPEVWPPILGYNKLTTKAGAEVIAEINGDPFICVGTYGEGKTMAWASDCAPHWLPAEFCDWEYNKVLWSRLLSYITGRNVQV
jgi:uncharacterized membrane protein